MKNKKIDKPLEKSLQTQDIQLENNRIEILIEMVANEHTEQSIISALLGFFRKDDSPVMPLYVNYELGITATGEGKYGTALQLKNFQIVEVNKNSTVSYDVLANIRIQVYPLTTNIFVHVTEHGLKNWGKIKKITNEIISKMQELRFNIVLVKPKELQPQVLLPELVESDSQKDKSTVRLPKGPLRFNSWQRTWRLILPLINHGDTIQEISERLDKTHPKLPHSRGVLAKIVAAGVAGKLDTNSRPET